MLFRCFAVSFILRVLISKTGYKMRYVVVLLAKLDKWS